MFEGFEQKQVNANGVTINLKMAGSGEPLLLLHGYPQTHMLWHKIAPQLAEHFTVVATDLRGYGDSSKPKTKADHSPYSKRNMAKDQVDVMQQLGFESFYVAGHDRGGRVGHRMALDHPVAVKKLVVLDIAPTLHMYSTTDMSFALAYYHWFFLIQAFDLPERLIGADPEYYMRKKLRHWGKDNSAFTPDAMKEYLRCFRPETIHASCEDYRASATIDLKHDQETIDNLQFVNCPLLTLWGNQGFVGHQYDVVEVWKEFATDVRGFALPCGHFLPEEAPEESFKALLEFFH